MVGCIMSEKLLSLDELLKALKKQPSTDVLNNPYRKSFRLDNLKAYLELMETRRARPILLVGEALGYKGGGLTGIPFSSGKVLLESDHPFLKKLKPYLSLDEIDAENTASIVWQYLSQLPSRKSVPLFWNAFPFHPHPSGNPNKNRAPNSKEIEQGIFYLRSIAASFKPKNIVGIGHAGVKCARLSFPDRTVEYIRHPSFGGKADFVSGMNRLLAVG